MSNVQQTVKYLSVDGFGYPAGTPVYVIKQEVDDTVVYPKLQYRIVGTQTTITTDDWDLVNDIHPKHPMLLEPLHLTNVSVVINPVLNPDTVEATVNTVNWPLNTLVFTIGAEVTDYLLLNRLTSCLILKYLGKHRISGELETLSNELDLAFANLTQLSA